jgi:menaquinone-dependent protoporphyrinogen IX oxidase
MSSALGVMDAHFCPIQDIGDLAMFDAVVLGSGVYMGSWMPEAREFVEKKKTLASMPVWLFSSGPSARTTPSPMVTRSRSPVSWRPLGPEPTESSPGSWTRANSASATSLS